MSLAYLAYQWHRALKIMQGFSRFSPSAKRCLESLQLLNAEIMEEIDSDPDLYHEAAHPDLLQRHDPSSAGMVFPEPNFQGIPLDYTWIDSLPVDLSIASHILEKSE